MNQDGDFVGFVSHIQLKAPKFRGD